MPDGSTWRHEYVITDHLGSTRLRFSDLDGSGTIDSTELLSTHDYYPFGLEWQDGGYKYTYNGKEIDRELGLNWHHYGKRMYDAVLGRFTGVDPISDQFPWVSTFNYAENEPVGHIDLWGLQKYKPKMKRIEKPSDLVSMKMLHNVKEGIKTASIEFGSLLNDGLNAAQEKVSGVLDLLQGDPNASDFHDDGSSIRGSGFEEMTGDSELNASGTDNTPTAEEGATTIIDEMLTPSAGVSKDEFGRLPSLFDYFGESTKSARMSIDKSREFKKNQEDIQVEDVEFLRYDTVGGNIMEISRPKKNE